MTRHTHFLFPVAAIGLRFSETKDISGTFAISGQVVGKLYAANYTSPTPSTLGIAVGDMGTAIGDAAGRLSPDFTEFGTGEIGGETLVPGLYAWSTGVSISTHVTFKGGPKDVWILQIAGGIAQAAGVKVLLAGGARAKNIFWQSAGAAVIGTNAHFEGIVLAETGITLATNATVNGRLYSKTAVTLDASVVKQPAE